MWFCCWEQLQWGRQLTSPEFNTNAGFQRPGWQSCCGFRGWKRDWQWLTRNFVSEIMVMIVTMMWYILLEISNKHGEKWAPVQHNDRFGSTPVMSITPIWKQWGDGSVLCQGPRDYMASTDTIIKAAFFSQWSLMGYCTYPILTPTFFHKNQAINWHAFDTWIQNLLRTSPSSLTS